MLILIGKYKEGPNIFLQRGRLKFHGWTAIVANKMVSSTKISLMKKNLFMDTSCNYCFKLRIWMFYNTWTFQTFQYYNKFHRSAFLTFSPSMLSEAHSLNFPVFLPGQLDRFYKNWRLIPLFCHKQDIPWKIHPKGQPFIPINLVHSFMIFSFLQNRERQYHVPSLQQTLVH